MWICRPLKSLISFKNWFDHIIPKNRGRTRRHKAHEEKRPLCSWWLCERTTPEIPEDTFDLPRLQHVGTTVAT